MRLLSLARPATLLLALLPALPAAGLAQDYSWPREIGVQQDRIVLYQPQPEKLSGNYLTARAAVSLSPSGQPDLVFGAVWLSGTIETDRDEDLVVIRNIHVTKVRWPNVTDEQAARFTQIVDADFPKDGLRMTLTRLTASLATAEKESESPAPGDRGGAC